ncbi:condensation domain-containing protein [Microbispora sp. KK1-11]|uniref:condensation domain-containing protein n=1 Tax=Microbispora sp. KK1-11 TaxID=2053005 RepID=UPI0021AF72DA|nr:condensation domain-containing protein [Microbispora sp. KK1-11]
MSSHDGEPFPLLWGQRLHWQVYRITPPGSRWRNNALFHWAIPDGATLLDVRESVSSLIGRHQALRTRYGIDADGRAVQTVEQNGIPDLRILDIEGRADPVAAAQEFVAGLHRMDFDLEAGPPVRVGLVVQGEIPRWLAFVVHHIVTDWLGAVTLRTEFRDGLDEEWRKKASVSQAAQPRSVAGQEASEAGRRTHRSALLYWQNITREFPDTTLPVPAVPPVEFRPGEVVLKSEAAARAVVELSRRYGAPEAAVVLGLYAMLLAAYTGNDRLAIRMFVANRFRRELLGLLGCLYQTMPVLLDAPAGCPLEEVFARARAAITLGYRYGSYDQDEIAELVVREQFHRGVNLSTMPAFNFLPTRSGGNPDASAESELTWRDIEMDIGDPLELLARWEGDAMRFAIRCNSALIPPEQAVELLVALEELAVRAGEGATRLDAVRVPARERGAGWINRRGSWIWAEGVAGLLRAHPAVDTVTVGSERGVLTARIDAGRTVTVHELRAFLAGALAAHPAAVVPDRFVLTTPDGTEEGDGRDAPGRDGTDAEDLLASIVGKADPAARDRLPYLVAGGTLAGAERVLAELETAGHTGLTYADLTGYVPFHVLATKIRSLDTVGGGQR